jgi:integrase
VIQRVPRIRLLNNERIRDYVLPRGLEQTYLEGCAQPLRDVAILILETALRAGEALGLRWADVHLVPASGKKFGYLQIREGKTSNAQRAVSLTPRATALLAAREHISDYVFPSESLKTPYLVSSLSHAHAKVRVKLALPEDFVLHSLRHTALTRLGDAGVGAFEIMRIAGHSTVTVSQRYVHPSSDAMETAFEKFVSQNGTKMVHGGKRGTARKSRKSLVANNKLA